MVRTIKFLKKQFERPRIYVIKLNQTKGELSGLCTRRGCWPANSDQTVFHKKKLKTYRIH